MAKRDPALLHESERGVLVLQGGGALGAYQAGVFEELNKHGIDVSWLTGVSIGAVNAAIIAGNPPELRLERLHKFWNTVSSRVLGWPLNEHRSMHQVFSETSAVIASTWGVPGFFAPRFVPPVFQPEGSLSALSYYDSAPLRATLESLIDFGRLNSGEIRLSLGAVNIKSGNYVYFDTQRDFIGPEHIMASGALPPGLPPIMIDNEAYWDGGIVSNTPLQVVLDEQMKTDLCVFQVDVFSAKGDLPRTIFDVYEREKEIRYSSRTRLNTDNFLHEQKAHIVLGKLLDKLPPDLADCEEANLLRTLVPRFGTTIVHLIYRRRAYEASTYDYEFSRHSVGEHWQAGRDAVTETLRHPHWKNRKAQPGVIEVLDLTKPGKREAGASETSDTEAQAPAKSVKTRSLT